MHSWLCIAYHIYHVHHIQMDVKRTIRGNVSTATPATLTNPGDYILHSQILAIIYSVKTAFRL